MFQDRGSKECVEADHRLRMIFLSFGLSRQHFNLFDVGSPVEIPVTYDQKTAKTTAQHYHAFTYKYSTSSLVAEKANNLYFGIASRSFSDKIQLDRLTLDHDGLHMTGPPKRFDQPAWEFSRGLLSHKLTLATFEDNKIRSAELTSESDKFIHILYGVFYS